MYELKELERYLRVNLLGPGPRLIKKNLPDRSLTKVEKHWSKVPNSTLIISPTKFKIPRLSLDSSYLLPSVSVSKLSLFHKCL